MALYDGADDSKPTLNFVAVDPDVDSDDSQWRELKYTLTQEHFDAEAFTIESASGRIQPSSAALGAIDFEALVNRPGIGDGEMRINVVATDGGGQAVDCDLVVTVLDVNEPPVINHIASGGVHIGESRAHPFMMSSSKVNVGDLVGLPLPAEDPDTIAGDIASCQVASLESSGEYQSDDRALFDITEQCQIYVRKVSAAGRNIASGTSTEYYTLYVEAYDRGKGGSVLHSDKRMYYIHATTGLIAPVLNIAGVMFAQAENTLGTVPDQAYDTGTTKDYSHWGISAAHKLFVACTGQCLPADDDRARLASSPNPDCSTYTSKSACIGQPD